MPVEEWLARSAQGVIHNRALTPVAAAPASSLNRASSPVEGSCAHLSRRQVDIVTEVITGIVWDPALDLSRPQGHSV